MHTNRGQNGGYWIKHPSPKPRCTWPHPGPLRHAFSLHNPSPGSWGGASVLSLPLFLSTHPHFQRPGKYMHTDVCLPLKPNQLQVPDSSLQPLPPPPQEHWVHSLQKASSAWPCWSPAPNVGSSGAPHRPKHGKGDSPISNQRALPAPLFWFIALPFIKSSQT